MAQRALLAVFCAFRLSAAAWLDCDKADPNELGPYGAQTWFNDTAEDGTLVFIFHPPLPGPYPVMIFSHGATGEYAMYTKAIERYVSHGFVVIFPHIKSPKKDTSPFTLDPMGGFTIKGFHYATQANVNASNPLKGALDLTNVVLAGHSMGATSTIMGAKKLTAEKVDHHIKVAVAQHPGLCGPYGPPPCLPGSCSTWMPADFKEAYGKIPMVLTTATNDGAFWPSPYTAPHEHGCYNKSVALGGASKGSAFIQFSEAACEDDGTGGRYDRHWSTGGHDCPMKPHSVETRWVLVAAKLYGQLDGNTSSHCHQMLWDSGSDSMRKDAGVEKFEINAAATAVEEVVVV